MLVATSPTSAWLKRPSSSNLRRACAPAARAPPPAAASSVGARGRFGAAHLFALRVTTTPARSRTTQPVRAQATATPGFSKMHDFCMTLPYGAFVALGGLAGFLSKGSVPSLVAGGGSGVLLLLLGVLSLKAWKSGKKGASAPYTAASAVLAAALTAMMGKKFLITRAFFPPGVVAGLSAAMLLFYVYNLASGGNPPQRAKAQ